MTKKYRNGRDKESSVVIQGQTKEFITTKGIHVTIRGVGSLKQTKIHDQVIEELGPRPTPPTYTMELAGGAKEDKPHNPTTLETDEEKAAYAAYLTNRETWDITLTNRLLRLYLMDGVIVDLPEDDRWIRRQAKQHIKVPIYDPSDEDYDEDDLLLHYIETEVMSAPEDAAVIGAVIRKLSGMDEEGLALARKLFRPEMEEPSA